MEDQYSQMMPPFDQRIYVALDQPNGVTELFFANADGALFSHPAYLDMIRAAKRNGDVDERERDLNAALEELAEDGYLRFSLVAPNSTTDELLVEERDGLYKYLNGEPWFVDSILVTDMPMR